MRAAAPRLGAGIFVAALLNLILIAAYGWSEGGQKTTVRVETIENRYRVELDGKQLIPRPDSGERWVQADLPSRGSLALGLYKGMPSLPDPQGIDSVVVTDPRGRVLFREDFDSLDEGLWEVTSGAFEIEKGVLVARRLEEPNQIELRQPGWGDQIVTVTYRNSPGDGFWMKLGEKGFMRVALHLIGDSYPTYVEVFDDEGEWTGTEYAAAILPDRTELLKSIVAMIVGVYPNVLLALATALGVSLFLTFPFAAARAGMDRLRLGRRLAWRQMPHRVSAGLRRLSPSGVAAGALAVLTVVVLADQILNYHFAVPQLPDEDSYVYQAKLFAEGRLSAPVPPVKEAFEFWQPSFLLEHDGQWSTFYPFGQPLALAFGAAVGAIWLVPPLLGGASVGLIYLAGSRLYNRRVGLAAAVLLATSPFFLLQASTFMAHSTWVFFTLIALFCLVERKRPVLSGLVGGIAFGLALNTRTVETALLAPLWGAVVLRDLLPGDGRLRVLKHASAYAAGAALMVAAMLAYNASLTGDLFTSPYQAMPTYEPILGFQNGHTLENGLHNQQQQIMGLIAMLSGWPAWVALGFVLLPFVLGTRNRWDYFCLLAAVLLIGVYVLYKYAGIYKGPRYLLHALPFLFLLSAHGADEAVRLIRDVIARLVPWPRLGLRPPAWPAALVVFGFLGLLMIDGAGGWLFGWNKDWTTDRFPNLHNTAQSRIGTYFVDKRLVKLKDELGLHHALVMLDDCGEWYGFACYGAIFPENDVDFNGDVVWARYLPDRVDELIEAYADRSVYIATWEPPSIVPYRPEPPAVRVPAEEDEAVGTP